MSRIKNTIESVSKAVSGTHSELVSRIARLKSHSGTSGKANKSSADANNISTNLENDKQVTDVKTQDDCNRGPAAKKSTCASENLESVLVGSNGTCQDTPEVSASTKSHLFHVSYFSTNFGETYNFVADHINSYFNNYIMEQGRKRNALLQDSESEERNKLDSSANTVPSEEKRVNSAGTLASEAEILGTEKTNTALPVSTKKSITDFLSYPSNSVQAFVDSYIGGLVPKLRSDTKVVSPEKCKQQEQEVSEKSDEDKAKEAKTVEEREKHLSLQREKASLCFELIMYYFYVYFIQVCICATLVYIPIFKHRHTHTFTDVNLYILLYILTYIRTHTYISVYMWCFCPQQGAWNWMIFKAC